MEKPLVQHYIEECGRLKLRQSKYIAEQFHQLETEPTTFLLPANYDKRLLPDQQIKPVVNNIFRSSIRVFERLNLLKIVDLESQQLGDELVLQLLGAFDQSGCKLDQLNLGNNCLSNFAAKQVILQQDKLKSLNLSRNQLTDSFFIQCQRFSFELELLSLNLSQNQLSGCLFQYFGQYQLKKLQILNLSYNNLSTESEFVDFKEFCVFCALCGLNVDFEGCGLNKLQLKLVNHFINQGKVVYFNLLKNGIDQELAKMQEKVVHNTLK